MAKLLSGTRIYGNATVDTSITVGTNVAAANVVITNASRLGTVTSGTWNGSSISTTYTDAKVTSVNGQTGAATGFATTANSLSQFASTTSAQLATLISDETGSGALVFATTPTLVTPILGLATGTSVMLSANIGAAAGNVSGNFTAGTLQTTGNVNANNLRVVTNSSLGTVVQGTWNGSSISTTFTDAKIVSVSNTAPISATTSSGAVTVGLLNSGVSAATYGNATFIPVLTVDQYGRVTSASNVAVSVSSGDDSGGYILSTITTFPGNTGNVDYGDTTNSADAFGVSLIALYDCMEPSGRMVYEDFAAL
jgi:hypothetical protein